jgi:hypothetical protein
MDMQKNKINLIFHKIVNNEQDITDRYDYVLDEAINLVNRIRKVVDKKGIELNVFLDDGDRSQFMFAEILSKKMGVGVYISLIANCVNKNGYLSSKEIKSLSEIGVKFCSHGFSHAALGRYKNNVVLNTPIDGEYKDFPRGHGNLLYEESVKFQIIESFKKLKKLHINVNSFVYPYGIYNEVVQKILRDSHLYDRAYTCDNGIEDIESDKLATPRFMIYNDLSAKKLISNIEECF